MNFVLLLITSYGISGWSHSATTPLNLGLFSRVVFVVITKVRVKQLLLFKTGSDYPILGCSGCVSDIISRVSGCSDWIPNIRYGSRWVLCIWIFNVSFSILICSPAMIQQECIRGSWDWRFVLSNNRNYLAANFLGYSDTVFWDFVV